MHRPLSPAERQTLRGRAHRLHPVVLVGANGLGAPLLAEIDRALAAHELIKIRVTGSDRADRERLLAQVCAATGAAPVQHIGKVLVVYREAQQPPPAPPPHRAAGRKLARPGRPPRRAQIRSR